MTTTTVHPDPHRHHRHNLRLSLPSPSPLPTSRLYPSSPFPFSPSAVSTPSKSRRSSSSSSSPHSLPSLLLLLLSLRSLYSVLPFLRSSPPSSSLFPFSFLVSLLSTLLLSLPFLSSPSPDPNPFPPLRLLLPKSLLLAVVLLLRFQSLLLCGTAPTILADLSGSLLAKSLSHRHRLRRRLLLGLSSLAASLLLLSLGWHRSGCFPFSPDPCRRLLPILLPFLSGFLSFFERAAATWGSLKLLPRRRVRLLSLALATVILFFPASITFFLDSGAGDDARFSIWKLGWPLINTVLFGVILSENYGDDKVLFSAKDFRRDFMVTFFCTLVLELFYDSKLSLPGFLLCGLLLWISVRELGSSSLNYVELGSSNGSESLYSLVVNPIRHILSERKSRKIAVFLLINAGYMVVEFVAGFMSNSLGLISDACHMLFDCAALAIGLYASYISRLPANSQFNYGRGRFEVLSGYVNAVLLVLVGALIVLESVERILDPQEISTSSLLVVSVGGFLVNVVGLIFFHEEHHHAHGGGSACSHSHSHSNSHSHSHHHHHEHDSTDHIQEHSDECHQSGAHSHDNHHHHHNHSDSHSSHHNDHITNHVSRVDHHDNHCSDHEHDHRCHQVQEQDHRNHLHGAEHHDHQNSDMHKHEFQNLDIPCTNSHDHSHDDRKHNECLRDKNSCSHEEPSMSNHMSDHAHSRSSHSKQSSTHKDSRKHRHIDHNMEGIFLHVLADTLGSVGVVISTLLIKYKGWLVADPACSIFISVMIISSVIPLLRNSAEILLQRIPRAHEQDLRVALDDIMKVKGVCGVQKLHVWNFTNADIVGTLHLHVSPETNKAYIKDRASDLMHEAGIKDVTIQVECVKE